MRRLICITIVALVGAAAPVALAASVHFKKPAPAFTQNADLSLTATGSLSGLGNGDVKVVLDAAGTGTALCENPGGSSKVPGQNPVAVNGTGVTLIPSNKVKNGVVAFSVTTAAPEKPTPTQAGCPTNKWSVVGFTVTYTSATIKVFQDASGQNGIFDAPGTLVLEQTFSL